MQIRLIEGLHLTATNKRHLAEIIGNGWTSGKTGLLSYTVEPIADQPNRYRYTCCKRELDDFGRPTTREGRGIIEFRSRAA